MLWLWRLDHRGLPRGPRRGVKAHADWLFDVAFSADGRVLATGGGDNRIIIWDTKSLRPKTRMVGHTDDVHALVFGGSHQTLVSAGDDMTVRIWDVASGDQLHDLTGHDAAIPTLALSPNRSLIIATWTPAGA